MAITVEHQKVTPEQAKKWLEKNKKNRHLNDNTVRFYLTQMHKGQWKSTGDTIKISKKGNLMDGQHRLSALVQYGRPLDMFVAEGLEEETITVIDTGKSRSTADVVSMLGVKNANVMSGMVKGILAFKNGKYSDPTKNKHRVASHTDVVEFIERHRNQIQDQCSYVLSLHYQFRYIPPGPLGMLFHILCKQDVTKAETFFSKYASGIDLSERSPIRALRNRLMRDIENKRKLTYRDKAALFIHAWNAYRKGKELGTPHVTGDYKFPTPV